MEQRRHTKVIHFIVKDGASFLVCEHGWECCHFPAGRFEMDEAFRISNNESREEASHDAAR